MKVFPPSGEHEPNPEAAMADGVQSFSHDGASQRFQDSGVHSKNHFHDLKQKLFCWFLSQFYLGFSSPSQ